jgi:hypothetical protein
LKCCPSNILIEDFTNSFKLELFKNYLLRGTIANDNKIGIINLKENSYSISFYDVNELEKNRIFSFNHAYDSLPFKPSLILTKNEKELLVVDNANGDLIIFDNNFKQTRREYLELFDYNDMAIDEETNDVYFVRCVRFSNVKVYDYNNRKERTIDWRKKDLLSNKFKSRFIRVVHGRIFIVNACSLAIDKDTNEIIEPLFGESYIYVLDKYSFDVKVFLDLNNYAMCQPWNLIIDKDLNIYTTCALIENKRYISSERYLCKFDKGGDPQSSIPLKHNYLSNDMIFIDDKLVFYKENEMIIYKK